MASLCKRSLQESKRGQVKAMSTQLTVSSVDRALHRYRKGHMFKSRAGLNFVSVHQCEALFQIYCFKRSLNIWFLYIFIQNKKIR